MAEPLSVEEVLQMTLNVVHADDWEHHQEMYLDTIERNLLVLAKKLDVEVESGD